MKNNSKLIVNLLTGVAVGAVIGILIAPGKGRTSRRKVDLFLTNIGDTLKDNAENQFNLLDNLKDSLKYALKERMANKSSGSEN